jgi:hypothetical protein
MIKHRSLLGSIRMKLASGYRHVLLMGLIAAGLGLTSKVALALQDSDKEAVRSLSNQAADEFKQDHFEVARAKFMSAYAIAKVPRLAVWAARSNARLGQLVAAYELYREALSLQPNDLWKGDLQQQAQLDAQRELAELDLRIPRVTIVIDGVSSNTVSATIDEVPLPSALLGVERLVDPGSHKLEARFGGETCTELVQIAEGERKEVVLKLGSAGTVAPPTAPLGAPAQGPAVQGTANGSAPKRPHKEEVPIDNTPVTPRGRTQRIVGWTTLGVGSAGLVLGSVAGVYLAAKASDLKQKCPERTACNPLYQSDVNTFNTMRTLSTVGFVVGGIGVATGVTLLLLHPERQSRSSVALWLGLGTADLRGEF